MAPISHTGILHAGWSRVHRWVTGYRGEGELEEAWVRKEMGRGRRRGEWGRLGIQESQVDNSEDYKSYR